MPIVKKALSIIVKKSKFGYLIALFLQLDLIPSFDNKESPPPSFTRQLVKTIILTN
jgi:hypothetical protein